jgi:DNA-binding transcriptional ArsR family regulator
VIAQHFRQISRPAVSQHLRLLVDAELLDVRQAGRRLYRFQRKPLEEAVAVLDDLWSADCSDCARSPSASSVGATS